VGVSLALVNPESPSHHQAGKPNSPRRETCGCGLWFVVWCVLCATFMWHPTLPPPQIHSPPRVFPS
jgi:hypothetical protein